MSELMQITTSWTLRKSHIPRRRRQGPVHTGLCPTTFWRCFRSPSTRSQDFFHISKRYKEEGSITKYLTDVTHLLKDHDDLIGEFWHFLSFDVCNVLQKVGWTFDLLCSWDWMFHVHLTGVCCSGTVGIRAKITHFLLLPQVLGLHSWNRWREEPLTEIFYILQQICGFYL